MEWPKEAGPESRRAPEQKREDDGEDEDEAAFMISSRFCARLHLVLFALPDLYRPPNRRRRPLERGDNSESCAT